MFCLFSWSHVLCQTSKAYLQVLPCHKTSWIFGQIGVQSDRSTPDRRSSDPAALKCLHEPWKRLSTLDIPSVPWLQRHVIPSYILFRVKVQYHLNRKYKLSQEKIWDMNGLSATDHKSESWDLINKLLRKMFTIIKKTPNTRSEI